MSESYWGIHFCPLDRDCRRFNAPWRLLHTHTAGIADHRVHIEIMDTALVALEDTSRLGAREGQLLALLVTDRLAPGLTGRP